VTDRRDTALELASEIAASINASAFVDGDQCNWMATVQRGGAVRNNAEFTYETLGPDVYSGTAGVALFLAEWHGVSGDRESGERAAQALRHAMANRATMQSRMRCGFYSGPTGLAWVLARSAVLLGREEFAHAAVGELDRMMTEPDDPFLLDVISGAAGSIGPLRVLAESLGKRHLIDEAVRLGDRILSAAIATDQGLTWGVEATGFATAKPLTGLGHGAAGIGWALLELFDVTGEARYRDAAREAFRYEQSLFSTSRSNWPDLRYSDATSEGASFGVGWCLGAPGIGLSRMRARSLDNTAAAQYDADIAASLHNILQFGDACADIGRSDFSLCHGWAGLGDILMTLTSHPAADTDEKLIDRIVSEGAAANRGHPAGWRCGMQRGSTPGLLLGHAGIGHFFLRLANPAVHSVLLIHPPMNQRDAWRRLARLGAAESLGRSGSIGGDRL
jgi:lantibiotic modifying enzyme